MSALEGQLGWSSPGREQFIGVFFFLLFLIYLAALALSCGTQDIHCSMRDLCIVVHGLLVEQASLVVAHGSRARGLSS